MSALGRFVTAHRWLVALAWLAVLAAALAGAGHVGGRLSQQFSLPGQPGYEANQPARAAAITATLRAAVPGASVWVTGLPALNGGGRSSDPGVVAETLLGALAVLALVFGSLLALIPLLVAAAAILSTFLLVLG